MKSFAGKLVQFINVIILSLLTGFGNMAQAGIQATYYVSPTGSDSNPGTLAQPFQTIAKARDVVRTVNGNIEVRYR